MTTSSGVIHHDGLEQLFDAIVSILLATVDLADHYEAILLPDLEDNPEWTDPQTIDVAAYFN